MTLSIYAIHYIKVIKFDIVVIVDMCGTVDAGVDRNDTENSVLNYRSIDMLDTIVARTESNLHEKDMPTLWGM